MHKKTYQQILCETLNADFEHAIASKILTLAWLHQFDSSTKAILLKLCHTDDDTFLVELIEDGLLDKRYVPDVHNDVFFLTEKANNNFTTHLSSLAP